MTLEGAKLLTTSTSSVEWYKSHGHTLFLSKVIFICVLSGSLGQSSTLCLGQSIIVHASAESFVEMGPIALCFTFTRMAEPVVTRPPF